MNAKYMLVVLTALCVAAGGPASAKRPNPQYINIAPLPGAGIALNTEGDPDGQGAFQINIPVAYTPRIGYASLSADVGRFPNVPGAEQTNFSGTFAISVSNKPAVFLSAMQVSHVWKEAKAVNGQMNLLPEKRRMPSISIGMQDILEKEKGNRSLYGVTTKKFNVAAHPIYATLGYGTGRFLDVPFAGVSVPLGGSFNFAAEWDGWQFNTGVGWRPGGRRGWLTFLGAYNGKTGFLAGGAAAFRFGAKG